MTNNLPFVSIIIPCRNEEKFIGKCLDSIIAQEYPKDKLEVLVVDGMSNDKTRDVLKVYADKYSFIKTLDNPQKVTPIAMNVGIKKAYGDYILILSSHSKIDKIFVKKNIENILKNGADCVGGVMITLPANDTILVQSIAFSLSHPFGVGNAYFRIGSKEPKYVDTVPFGCYKREVFQRMGLFDEDLARNQDDEFNLRLIKNGGKILLVPDIVSYYYARDSLRKLWKMYFQYGYFKPLVVKKVGAVLTGRQLMPGIFVGSLIVSGIFSPIVKPSLWFFLLIASIYTIFNVSVSCLVGFKKGLKYISVLPLIFATLHLSYGIGYLKGILDFMILKKYTRKKIKDIPLSR